MLRSWAGALAPSRRRGGKLRVLYLVGCSSLSIIALGILDGRVASAVTCSWGGVTDTVTGWSCGCDVQVSDGCAGYNQACSTTRGSGNCNIHFTNSGTNCQCYGNLSCSCDTCHFRAACEITHSTCGNGRRDSNEVCDPSASNAGCAPGSPCKDDCSGCVNRCGNGVVDKGEPCDFAATVSGCPAGQICTGGCFCSAIDPSPPCDVTCGPGDNMLCGDVSGCNLFCYSSAWAPDPLCPAFGCGGDMTCGGRAVVHWSTPPAPPPPPLSGPYQGNCSPGYVDCDQFTSYGTGCQPGTSPDYNTCY